MGNRFTFEEFLTMMANYNITIWPFQIVIYFLTIIILGMFFINIKYSNRILSSYLGILWIWVGIAFNYLYFSKISPGAFLFAVLFLIQGCLFLYNGAIKGRLVFGINSKLKGFIGLFIVGYSLIGYPIIEYSLDRGYPESLPFGLTPCPLTVFTLGMLIFLKNEIPFYIVIIPILYSLGSIIPISVGIYEDIGLLISGILLLGYFMLQRKKQNSVVQQA